MYGKKKEMLVLINFLVIWILIWLYKDSDDGFQHSSWRIGTNIGLALSSNSVCSIARISYCLFDFFNKYDIYNGLTLFQAKTQLKLNII